MTADMTADMTLSQALAAQTQEFPSWEEMSDVEQLHTYWWDAHKDAYGVRPRGQNVGHWTAEDFLQELDRLEKVMELYQVQQEEELRQIEEQYYTVANTQHR